MHPFSADQGLENLFASDCSSSLVSNNHTSNTLALQQEQVHKLWSSKRLNKSTPLIRSLWHDVSIHTADNIFSRPLGYKDSDSCPIDTNDNTTATHLYSELRKRLVQYCRDLRGPPRPGIFDPRDKQAPKPSFSDDVPPIDVIKSSLDTFYQTHRMGVPFIHLATFNVATLPCSMMLPILLLGLTHSKPRSTSSFLSTNITVCLVTQVLFIPLQAF